LGFRSAADGFRPASFWLILCRPVAIRVAGFEAVAKRASKTGMRPDHSWAIYHIRGTPAPFIGIVEAPDEQSAIAKAIQQFGITGEQQKRLLARRRD
jgi:hypothetical protein